MELNMAAISDAIAAAHPDREALLYRDRRFTWADLAERTTRLANVFASAGLGVHGEFGSVPRWESVHDHVALYLHNGNEYLESMLGAWKARCAPFNVNYRYVAEELAYLLADSNAAAVVIQECFAPTLAEVLPMLDRAPRLILQVSDGSGHPVSCGLLPGAIEFEQALSDASPSVGEPSPAEWSGDDIYLCYTGGTTGMPKGAMWRQEDFLIAALGVKARDGSEYRSMDDLVAAARGSVRALPAPPLMHGAAHWNALSAWVAGGTVVIQDRPAHFDPADVVEAAERHGVTSLLLVGDPMARPLVDELRAHPRDLGSVRHVLSGGAVLSPGTKRALQEVLPGAAIVDVLGSTESGRQGVSTTRPGAEAVSRFSPGDTAVVLDETRSRVLSPTDPDSVGQVGWLAQAGRVPLGYLGDPAKTEATFPEIAGVRYAVAGDRARWADDGTIELLGRDSVCINTGGEKVFAEEVETAAKAHPAVDDAVVCGRPSERWGEEVVAVVSFRGPEPDDEELISVMAEHIARYKLPKVIVRVPVVLRAPSGKADYRWAREMAEGGTDRR
ncbi:MAG: AMP-binding protein [Microthrixaceae bacterium]